MQPWSCSHGASWPQGCGATVSSPGIKALGAGGVSSRQSKLGWEGFLKKPGRCDLPPHHENWKLLYLQQPEPWAQPFATSLYFSLGLRKQAKTGRWIWVLTFDNSGPEASLWGPRYPFCSTRAGPDPGLTNGYDFMTQALLLNLEVGGWGWGRISTLFTDSPNLLINIPLGPSFPAQMSPWQHR